MPKITEAEVRETVAQTKKEAAFLAGRAARKMGVELDRNPYLVCSELFSGRGLAGYWKDGWEVENRVQESASTAVDSAAGVV